MKSFLESKAMAKALRQSLADRNINVSHSECLELIARQFGLADWNMLSAQIESAKSKQEPLPLPKGWFPTGFTDTQRYRMGLDPTSPGCALIECLVERDIDLGHERFACLMQSIEADGYRGATVCLKAHIRAEKANVGTIWMRIDREPDSTLRFDNMLQREENGAIYGSSGWIERSIVLDVPQEASSIHFGFFLKGYGKVWTRNFSLKTVAHDAKTTEMAPQRPEQKVLPKEPVNLGLSAIAS